MNNNQPMSNETIRLVFRNLKNHNIDKQFAIKTVMMLQTEENGIQMVNYLEREARKSITMSDVLIHVIEITRKADLIEGEFYKINPDLKS